MTRTVTKPKPSPAPWRYDGDGTISMVPRTRTNHAEEPDTIIEDEGMLDCNAEHIVDCVNACAGLDPIDVLSLVSLARGVLEQREDWHTFEATMDAIRKRRGVVR